MTTAGTGTPPLSGGSPDSGPFDAAGVDGFVRRLRGSYDEIHPQHWQIDWKSIPSPFRWYVDAPRTDLPPMPRTAAAGGTAAAAAFAAYEPLTRLGTLLQAGYGLTGVRWYPEGIAKSSPEEPTPVHRNPHYQLRRAVPSGGVTYPAECYVVTGGAEGLDAGIHHYDAVRHALAVLARGRPPTELTPPEGNVRIVLTQPLWKNYFKYGDFSYRLGAMDTGAVVGQFALAARSWNLRCRVTFGLDERRILELLGLDPEEEAAPAVLDLPLCAPAGSGGPRGRDREAVVAGRPRWLGASVPPGPATGTRRMHAACLAAGGPGRSVGLPPVVLEDQAGRADAELPPASTRPPTVADSWARSALGEQFRGSPLPAAVLAGWLGTVLAPLESDVTGSGKGNGDRDVLAHPRCLLVVRSVPGVLPGAYLPDQEGQRLVRLADGDFGPLVQRSMFADYMNVGQAPLVAVMVGSADPHSGAGGPVAYRTQHLLAGVLAQRLAVCAARDGMSAHPVLGFVSGLLDDAFGLRPRRLTSLLMVPVGGYRRGLYLENSLNPLAASAGNGGGK
ncbi:SagB family peptide dehydrogenase [Streptomyces sp. MUM 203J]|uniref:SagB family peptide dehydrogenase n=1 Tax=Streptomyces sp. MUM 203J TaxID=2791990 RepID=UPI001F0472DF|nr:SagB family peptide dehydrogenase [Streptomyces sp. MUM 203J]MCH0541432.1 SagB family peptide dehydrogenase [Streptomyces sp. MUM 203J]